MHKGVMIAATPVEVEPPAPPSPRRWRRRSRWLIGGAALCGIAALGVWTARKQLADAVLTRQFEQAGVDADYDIAELSLTHQRLRDVRIGDPSRPDLTAREVELWLGYSLNGPTVERVRLLGVRVRGQYDGERMSFGQLDRLLPAPSDEPVALPDLWLDLADAGAHIDTPWGRVAAGLAGAGNPTRDFAGTIAAISPQVRAGDCAGREIRGSGRIRSDTTGIRFSGPLRAAMVSCPAQALQVRAVEALMGLSAPVDLSALNWTGGITAARIDASGGSTNALRGWSDGRWDIARARGSAYARLLFGDARMAALQAQNGAVEGRVAFAGGQWRASGGLALAGTALRGDAARYAAALRDQRQAAVVGPVAEAVGAAALAAGRDFRISMPFVIRGTPGGVRADIAEISAQARSGARIALNAPDPVLRWRDGALNLAGQIAVAGGGLPTVDGAIQRTTDGSLTGQLAVAPYRAGQAELALSTVRFAIDRRGNGRFETALGLSGPFAAGRIDGLGMPLSGAIGPGGRVTIDSGCRMVVYRRLVVSTLVLEPQRLSLCSAPGQPLIAIGPEGVAGGVRTGATALSGRLGGSPVELRITDGRYDFDGTGAFRGVGMALGTDDSAVRLNAGVLTLRSTSSELSGSFSQADAQIGAIQLVLDGIEGQWRYAGSTFAAEGELDVSDVVTRNASGQVVMSVDGRRPFGRFSPMSIPNARLTLTNGIIEVAGQLQERSTATPVANVRLVHRLSSGEGDAAFNVVPLRFARDGLQPEQLTELALGVAANVEATVTGEGRIAWTPRGVTSSGEFSTEGANLAAAFGPVQGLSGTIRFNDLLSLSTPPGQSVRIVSINPGIEVVDGELRYQLLPAQQVRIEGGTWPFAGGTLRLHPGLLDLAADRPRYLTFDVEGIDAARFLQRYGFENITATGVFDGVLPTVFDGNGGRVENGSLVVRDGGGSLAYVGELSTRDLGYFGNLAFGALRSVRYDALVIRLNGNIDGEMLTEVSFTGLGQGPGAMNNFLTRQVARLPFAFNIRINAPFRQLLTSARSLYDPSILIDQNLPALVRQQAQAAARGGQSAPGEPSGPPVQQQESGNEP